jgi:hypothetical protein
LAKAAPERFGVLPFLRPRSQGAAHQFLEHFPGQAGAAAGVGTVVERVGEEQGEMVGEGDGGIQEVKDEGGPERQHRHARFATWAGGWRGGEVTEQLLPGAEEAAVIGWRMGLGFGFVSARSVGFELGVMWTLVLGNCLQSHLETKNAENRKENISFSTR